MTSILPLQIRIDPFTNSLLTNAEVLAIDQDALGKQGYRVKKENDTEVWIKELEDGSVAVGLFNLGKTKQKITAHWKDIKMQGKQTVRELWRQKELGLFNNKFESDVLPHGVVLIKINKR